LTYEKSYKSMKTESTYIPKETLKDVLNYPFMAMPSRNITKETCEKFGVRAGVSELDGKTVEAYYFPSFNQKGKVVGYKKQDITKDKSEDRHWTAIGSVSIQNKLDRKSVV